MAQRKPQVQGQQSVGSIPLRGKEELRQHKNKLVNVSESSMSEENTNALQETTFYRNRSWETSGLSDYGGNNS